MKTNYVENKTVTLQKGSVRKKALLIWGILCLGYVFSFFHRMSLGAVKADITAEFSMSATTFASLSSMFFYAYIIMQIPTGIFVDTVGPRKTVIGGLLFASIGSIIFGSATSLYQIFAGRFIIGLGVAVIFVSIHKILTNWFLEKEFATMNGITVLVGNLGGILAQSPLIAVAGILSWNYTFIAIGSLSFLVLIITYFFVKDNPESINDECSDIKKQKAISAKEIFTALLMVIKNKYVWSPFIVFVFTGGSFLALAGTWGQTYLLKVYDLSPIHAANYLILPIITHAIGAAVLGKTSDALSRRKLPIIILGVINLIAWSGIYFINNGKPSLVLFGILLSLVGASSSLITLLCPCSIELNNQKYAGISTSFMNTSGFIGAIIVPFFIGRAIDKYSGFLSIQETYNKAFFICFLGAVISFVFTFFIKETGCKNIWHDISKKN